MGVGCGLERATTEEGAMASEREWVARYVPDVRYQQNVYARALAEELRPGASWLELGAGSKVHRGWVGVPEAELVARAALLVGADLDLPGLRANRHLHAGVMSDAARLPFGDAAFDLVTSNMVVEHLADPASAFREVRRVLRPGGAWLFVTPCSGYPVIALSRLLPANLRSRLAQVVEGRRSADIFPTHYRCNTPGRVRRLAAAAGLAAEEVLTFNSFPFFRRPPLILVEGAWIRVTDRLGPVGMRSNLLARLRRPVEAAA